MFKNTKYIFSKINNIFFATFLIIFVIKNNSYAQFGGSSDIVREIEKSLLFDKETQEKFDVYNNEYGTNKLDKTTMGNFGDEGEDKKTYSPEEMNIVLVDKVKIDKDLREKEKLAYNSFLVGQYEIALELYKDILKKEPNNLDIKYSMAVAYQKLGQYKQAKNIYQELLKAGVDNQEDIINNVIAILIYESPREAINVLNRLSIQNPDKPYLYANIGLAYEKISNLNLAIANYIKAHELDKRNPNYSYNLAILYDKNKDYEKALEIYEITIKNIGNSNSDIRVDDIRKRMEIIKILYDQSNT